MKATLKFDGGARPTNPGHAGFGVMIHLQDGQFTKTEFFSRYIGIFTNNEAEYAGLIAGLKYALELGVREIEVISDSKLVINQVKGNWKCKEPRLKVFVKEARALLDSFERVKIRWMRRENNVAADDLCTRAIYAGMNRNPFIPKSIKDKRPGEIVDPFSSTKRSAGPAHTSPFVSPIK
jgi:ribonuclease HI